MDGVWVPSGDFATGRAATASKSCHPYTPSRIASSIWATALGSTPTPPMRTTGIPQSSMCLSFAHVTRHFEKRINEIEHQGHAVTVTRLGEAIELILSHRGRSSLQGNHQSIDDLLAHARLDAQKRATIVTMLPLARGLMARPQTIAHSPARASSYLVEMSWRALHRKRLSVKREMQGAFPSPPRR